MADLLRASERRLLLAQPGRCALPPTEVLVGRLDQIDLRLRQLEERQRPAEGYFTVDLQRATARTGRHQLKSLPSALHEAHRKGTLMDRLHLLETRIQQLSFELDSGSGAGGTASASATKESKENGSVAPARPAPEKKKRDTTTPYASSVVGGSWKTGEIFHRGASELQGHVSKTKAKEPKDNTNIGAGESRASAMCRTEKRRMERTRLYRRWFPVGC